MLTTIVFIIGMLINTILTAYLKKDINAVKRWIKRRENKSVLIFVLDDDEDDLEFIEEFVLKKLDHPYKLYTDEKQFLDELPQGVNIFVVDHFLMQTGVSGLDIAQKIKNVNENNFIIVYSGTQNDKTISDYVEMKIDRFVYKNNPDNYALLKKAITDGLAITSNL